MAVSNETTVRHLKRGAPVSCDKKLRVVGIDDWAWKKGQNYGTILVDLERHTVADLLPERSAQQVENWFKQHPGVEIVSRDRFGLYAKAAQRGAPQALQVADRFHLLVNLQEAAEHELSRQRRLLFYVDPSRPKPTAKAPLPTRLPPQPNAERAAQYHDVVAERRAVQQALFEKVHHLRHTGMNGSQIVRETGISRKRVDKWLRLAELPERNKMEPKMNSPAFFRDYLARRWAAGCHHVKTLLAELRTRGYRRSAEIRVKCGHIAWKYLTNQDLFDADPPLSVSLAALVGRQIGDFVKQSSNAPQGVDGVVKGETQRGGDLC